MNGLINETGNAELEKCLKGEWYDFFRHGLTTAAAERLNGKIKRFASNNYGIKDKDFFIYRTAKYFS
jgi:hypothetical protein